VYGLWIPDEFAGRVAALPDSTRYKVETEFVVSYTKQRTGLRSNRYKMTIRPGIVTLREQRDRRVPLHHPANQFLIDSDLGSEIRLKRTKGEEVAHVVAPASCRRGSPGENLMFFDN